MAKYGTEVPEYDSFGFTLHSDMSTATVLKPAVFRFERRANDPFELGLFYSTAPLMTADHLAVLEKIEKLL